MDEPASFLTLGAGVTPAEGCVKPTAGFTLNHVDDAFLSVSRRPCGYCVSVPDRIERNKRLQHGFDVLRGQQCAIALDLADCPLAL